MGPGMNAVKKDMVEQMAMIRIHEVKRRGDGHTSMPSGMTNVFPVEGWGNMTLATLGGSDSVKWVLLMMQEQEKGPQRSQMRPQIHGLLAVSAEKSIRNQNSK